ncbi:hypothetical protein JAAARDRAFT_127024 [Jaapia argillacea MUCL 33604]|uniref:RTA1 like protein n=1 Tax=Jaapia argillacea MUCL 33604 TaxID=933084 RepID=A0A067QB34_9AGAM|nr:hypothetical protein JAAARDRAFT_127024 [Jaapia argillacea MUCL 33604]
MSSTTSAAGECKLVVTDTSRHLPTDAITAHPTTTAIHPPHNPYNYVPTEWICVLFVVLFSITTILHIAQATRYRFWWLFPTAVLAGFAEVIGWAGRLWSSQNATLLDPFLMQITTTIIAPTPLVAANFIILGRIIGRLGSQYSRLSPMWYMIVFCSCDLIALIVQAIGGASASMAARQYKSATTGGHIMLGGIVFQMAAITIYVACAAEFFWCFYHDRPVRKSSSQNKVSRAMAIDKNTRLMIAGLALCTVTIFIRSVYRTVELTDGWNGRIISTQVYFNVLDGGMITIAMFTLNFFHPGRLLVPLPSNSGLQTPEKPLRTNSVDTAV